MSLPLSPLMDLIALGETETRSPAFSVFVYDIRSMMNTVADVVLDGSVDANPAGLHDLTGPLDITGLVKSIKVQENGGDYVASGIPNSNIQATLLDPDGIFNPNATRTDPLAPGRWFRRGNIIRIRVGDEQVPEAEWVDKFFGRIKGQVGYDSSRVNNRRELTFKAYGREANFIGIERTSTEWKNDGTLYFDMAEDVATGEMGLSLGEMDWAGFGTTALLHGSLTLAKEPAMSMLAKILFVDGLLPKFRGDGRLVTTSGLVTASSSRFYSSNNPIRTLSQPQAEVQPADAIKVVGLSAVQARIDQPLQVIGELSVTTGYFTQDEDLYIYWSDDRTALADRVQVRTIKSVNGGMTLLGGGERYFPITSPSPNSTGTIGFRITIDTGYAPYVAIFLLTVYVVLSFIPDLIVGFGIGAISGVTISIGRVIAAGALAAAMILMTKVGRGQYRFEGEPFEYVFAEIPERAAVNGISEFELTEIEVFNHLVADAEVGKVIAREILKRQQARGRPRRITMLHDPSLEPDDTFELTETGDRYLVESISYTLERGKPVIANVAAYDVTDNISAAT